MQIRKALPGDITTLMAIYETARRFMQTTGNRNQWIDGYPSEQQIMSDIQSGCSYVCCVDAEIVGVFYFKIGIDPTYLHIEDGHWLNEQPYGVIHRLASAGTRKGIGRFCLQWCFSRHPNIRIDTHEDNKVLQHLLREEGYSRCGIIYVSNGTSRVAFQKSAADVE